MKNQRVGSKTALIYLASLESLYCWESLTRHDK